MSNLLSESAIAFYLKPAQKHRRKRASAQVKDSIRAKRNNEQTPA